MSIIQQIYKHFRTFTSEESQLLANNAGTATKYSEFARQLTATVGNEQVELHSIVVPTTAANSANLPLAILIHGLGGQLWQFDDLVGELIPHMSVFAIDLPGHGKSEGLRHSPPTSELVDAIKKITDTVELPLHSKVVCIGHSMGSIIACKLAARFTPNAAFIALAPAVVDDFNQFAKLQFMARYMPLFIFDLFRASQRIGGPESKGARSLVSPKTTDNEIIANQRRINLTIESDAWLKTAAGVQPITELEALAFGSDALIVVGGDDTLTTPAKARVLASWLRRREDKSKKVAFEEIESAGHALVFEKPREIAQIILDFLKSAGILSN